MLGVAALLPGRRAVVVGLLVALSIVWIAFGAAAARAQPIQLCLKGGDADYSVQALLSEKQSVECGALNVDSKSEEQRRFGYCPEDAAYCTVLMQGSVGSEPSGLFRGAYSRDVTGTFQIEGERGPGVSKVVGVPNVLASDTCTVEGDTVAHVTCDKVLETRVKTYRWITGRCVATAGALRAPIGSSVADTRTHIDLQFCKIQVTPYYVRKGCRIPMARDASQRRGSPRALAASRSCRVRKGKPVSPPKGVRPPPAPPETFPPPSDQPPPPSTPDCTKDNLSDPPTPGCVRVTVRVIPAPLPSDPGNEAIGEGVGSATLKPGGKTVHCLNPQDAAACLVTADVPANTQASVTAQPGSLSEDPSTPPDSVFSKFGGACAGAGACLFTPAAGSTVDVYFIPAMVTLTLQASGDGGHANMTANEFQGGGLEPMGPVYCGFTYPANPLPCKVMVRVEKFAQVEANSAGDPNIQLLSFSNNCTPSAPGASFCTIQMTTDQTVTAMFGSGTLA